MIGVWQRTRARGSALLFVLLSLTILGCGETEFQAVQSSHDKEVTAEPVPFTKTCHFVDEQTLSSQLKNQLGFSKGDVRMIDEDGKELVSNNCPSYIPSKSRNSKDCYFLESLGDRFQDNDCSSTKFKLASELFGLACVRALDKEEVRNRLFPNGSHQFDTVYKTFTGRQPNPEEIDILRDLIISEGDERRRQSLVCAAVASSYASLTIN